MTSLIQDSTHVVKSLSEGATGLTLTGWIFISVVWTIIISLLIFCYRKILQKAAEKKQQANFQSTSRNNE